jgi:hypothetical protein
MQLREARLLIYNTNFCKNEIQIVKVGYSQKIIIRQSEIER